MFVRFVLFCAELVLRLRYKVTYIGLDKVKEALKNEKRGVLFMPNHPSMLDPVIVSAPLMRSFAVRPLIIEYVFYNPVFHRLFKKIKALPMANFATGFNPIKQRRAEKILRKMSDGLKMGDRFIIYPAGGTKESAKEILGGAFGAHLLVTENPDAVLVLVRTTGLWGSMFSRALTQGRAPDLMKGLKKAFWTILKNAVFFVPRRNVTVEFEFASPDLPRRGTKTELNRYLEEWYNRLYPEGEPLTLVSYAFWKNEVPVIQPSPEDKVELATIDDTIKAPILEKLSLLTKRPVEALKPNMHLIADLGLDSLDLAELVTFLHDYFDVAAIQPQDLTTVARLFMIAAHKYCKPEVMEHEWDLKRWKKKRPHTRVAIHDAASCPEAFLKMCDERLFDIACADPRFGPLTYRQVKMRVLLLADKIAILPGERIGIMLPSCISVQVLVLACQLAGKTPVMINWTVGGRHLDTVVEVSKIQAVLTSWAFLDTLENIDISRIEDMLIILEEMKVDISLMDKCRATFDSWKSCRRILEKSKFSHIQDDKSKHREAVILFTSGTEAMPKGVPLTHHNILSNQRAVLQAIELFADDSILAMLPAFHSFGFTVTGLMPLFAGFKAVYYPNPTESKRLAKAIKKWDVSIIASAPTFLKNMLLLADPDLVKSVRLMVSGAEKAPQELFDAVERVCPQTAIYEGYGITECSPVLTANTEGQRKYGVGKPLPGVSIKIVDQETHENTINGNTGLVLAAGPNVFSGYLNTQSSPFVVIDGTKWYKTGDLGKMDAAGHLILEGRLKRFVKIGGEMISLVAIEEALQEAAKEEAPKDEKQGALPQIAITATAEAEGRPKLILYSIRPYETMEVNHLLRQKGFSNLVKIDQVKQVKEIPLTATGKVSYRALEKL